MIYLNYCFTKNGGLKMNFKNENPFRYKVTSIGVFFTLQTSDNEEVVRSRELEDVAAAILEDTEVLMAYEEGRIDFSDIETCENEIKELIRDLKFEENFETEEKEDY